MIGFADSVLNFHLKSATIAVENPDDLTANQLLPSPAKSLRSSSLRISNKPIPLHHSDGSLCDTAVHRWKGLSMRSDKSCKEN